MKTNIVSCIYNKINEIGKFSVVHVVCVVLTPKHCINHWRILERNAPLLSPIFYFHRQISEKIRQIIGWFFLYHPRLGTNRLATNHI